MYKISIQRLLGLFVVVLFGLAGCGGEGTSGSDGTGNTNAVFLNASTNTSIKNNVSVVDSSSAKEIVTTQTDVNGVTSVNIAANSSTGNSLAAGSVISVLPGSDNRFPLGLSAKVESVVTNSDGTKQAVLQPATMADIVADSAFNSDPIPLNADNFIGVIAPQATAPTLSAKIAAKLLPQSGKTFLNGGIRVINAASDGKSAAKPISGGPVLINLKIKLADMGITKSAFDMSADAGFEISGSLENMELTQNYVFKETVDGLKSLDLRLTGDIQLETKFTGTGSAKLEYYDKAWDEVENSSILFGAGKLLGLSSKDKKGKFPVAGLVWAVGCPPSGCPVVIGNTKAPMKATKSGAVILWVYLTTTGEIKVEGNFGARINPGHFTLGVEKAESGKVDTISKLTNAGTGRFIELPFIDGKLDIDNARLGTGLDLDFFILGTRLANASLDIEGRLKESVDGKVSYGTKNLGEAWDWDGNICFSTNVGAGAIFGASINAGIELDLIWDKKESSFSYSKQWPTEADMLLPGWHGIGNKTWYTAAPSNVCYPKPMINSATTTENSVSRLLTITVAGKNIPDDLALSVSPAGSCTHIQPGGIASSQAVFSCTKTSDSTLTYIFKSDKAQNLDSSSASGLTYKTPAFTITGKVASSSGGLAAVIVNLSGNSTASTMTDINGNYSFAGVTNGDYTINLLQSGYTFTPVNYSVAVNNADVANKNFTGVATTTPTEPTTPTTPVTPTAQKLFYTKGASRPYGIYSANLDGTGETLLASASNAGYGGGKICYTDTTKVLVMNSDGSGQAVVPNTTDAIIYTEVDCSPDGTKIVYYGSTNNYKLYVINIDGTGKILFNDGSSISKHQLYPSWNVADTIYFGMSSYGNAASQAIYSKPANSPSATPTLVKSALVQWPSSNGPGGKVAYNDGNGNIFVMNADGTGATQLTAAGSGSTAAKTWGGSSIYFIKNGNIWKINADNTGLTQITTSGNVVSVFGAE